ncbi:hypothetical protein BU25DRAFT_409828 [Macroventuria anomochaeta]|uniref:Uncharacterized protein n=1 Tax=Macroventuria anomochaeta TaxID=301207 RepID=A0ACB6S5Y0_9PLEO|nr:uncharacterized protein BU25DRAFT_409828 [Macroventuria anomochaeta]KAF2628799.1 hypothetical protein BU25DRAFT_409828 [Macroventuria anomochaeta]
MKYRSAVSSKRYNHERQDDYHDKGKSKTLLYMQEKGFERPIDIWFDNLMHIMALKV